MRRCVKLGDGEEENSKKEICPKLRISAGGEQMGERETIPVDSLSEKV